MSAARGAEHDHAGLESRRVAAGDWLIPLGIALVPLAACLILSPARPFWTDELLTRVMVTDPSPAHMLAALRDTINAIPPLYFLLGWGWARWFGASELSLRLFSSLAVAAGAYFTWRMLRECHSRAAASLATLGYLAMCGELFTQNVEARCYGLYFMAFAAASALLWSLPRAAARGTLSWRHGAATLGAHALLVATHYVGIVLSAALLTASLLAWLFTRERMWRTHAALIVAGWLAFAPNIPFLLAQRSLGAEASWLARPSASELVDRVRCRLWGIDLAAGAFAAAALVAGSPAGLSRHGGVDARSPRGSRAALVRGLYVLSLLATVVGLWLVSRFGPLVFLERYFFPLGLAWAVAMAAGCDTLLAAWRESRDDSSWPARVRRGAALGGVAAIVMIAVAGARQNAKDDYLHPRYDVERARAWLAEHESPLFVTSDMGVFLPLLHYEKEADTELLLPSPEAVVGVAPSFRAIGTALRRHYLPSRVRRVDELERDVDRVAILETDHGRCLSWGALKDWRVVERSAESRIVILERERGP